MLNGKFRGRDIGSGTDVWRFAEEVKAGEIDAARVHGGRGRHVALGRHLQRPWARPRPWPAWSRRSGIALPHNAAIPAVDARRYVLAQLTGRRIVEHGAGGPAPVEDPDARGVRERDPRQRRDRRLDQRGDPPDGDRRAHRRAARRSTTGTRIGRDVPTLVDLHAVGPLPDGGLLLRGRPAGGAARASASTACCDTDALTVNGQTLWDERQGRAQLERRGDPPARQARSTAHGGIAVLRGNLAPDGAVLKPSAATPAPDAAPRPRRGVREHRGLQGAHRRPERSTSTQTCVLVLKNCGPQGLSRHGRGRQHGPAAQAAAQGRDATWCASRTRA